MNQDNPKELTNRILIIDDEKDIGDLLEEALGDYNCEVFNDPRKAIEVIESKNYDLLLTDIKMPHMTGIEILKISKKNNPEVPVLMLTGFGSKQDVIEALNSGAYGYLEKPFEEEEVVFYVKHALEKRRNDIDRKYLNDELKNKNKELKKINNTLQEMFKEKIKILNSLSEMLFILDNDGKIVSVNKKCKELLNYSESEFVNEKFSKILGSEAEILSNFNEVKKLINDNKLKDINATVKTSYGKEFPILVSGSLMKQMGEKRNLVILSAKDARDSRLLNELKNSQHQMIQTTKFAALGEMVGGVAHEINNPLGIIQADAEMIAELIEDTPIDIKLVKKMCREMSETIFRISDIIKSLKVISREGTNDPFLKESLSVILKESLILCKGVCRQNDVVLKTPKNIKDIQLKCRATQIIQVFMNLIRNSIDAIKDLKEKWIKIEIKETQDNIKIFFIDSGSGISQDVQEKMFHPFYTTKEVGKGTGLGLSVVKKVVEAHKGNIYVDRENSNTCFVVELSKKIKD